VDTLDALSYSAKTTSNSDLKIVSTGAINGVERAVYHGPEFAFAQGPLLLLGEYNAAKLARTDARTLYFTSWHLAAAWALTGESRSASYAPKAGEFKGLAPAQPFDLAAGHWGALELVARLAAIDLNDADITGGREQTLNVGVNWYLNTRARAMFDWTHILGTDGSSAIRRYAEGGNVVTLRAQYTF
jgi:phosphate-selective porin OprO/OprP